MTATIDAPGHAPDPATDRAWRGLTSPRSTALPRPLALLVHGSAGLIWLGAFAFYVRVWIVPWDAQGGFAGTMESVVDGTAAAPFQYRVLVPHLLVWLHDSLGWSYGFGETAVDLVALVIAVVATHAILRKVQLELWAPVVALAGAYVQIGALWWGKVETFTSFAATAVALWAILCDDRRRWPALGIASLVLAGTRSDLLLAVAIAAGARWLLAGKERRDLVASICTAIGAIGATVALKLAYPDARYDDHVGMLQVGHNLEPIPLLVTAAFVVPPLAPYLLARSQAPLRALVQRERRWIVPMLGLALAQVGAVFVVGRADEVRLFLPIAPALGVAAVAGWRAVLAPYVAVTQAGVGASADGADRAGESAPA